MGRYRRSILNRNSSQWQTEDPELARLVLAYEEELRSQSLIDFDDMPLLAVRALRENPWLQRAMLAKYPVLVVDEYQDLGRALHRMVMGLCFSTGIRLFAVGDADQSIYGFTGASPELLQQVAEREDVQTVRLRFNYRSGSRIVLASEYALGEERGYSALEGAPEGAIFFRPRRGNYDQQADYLFATRPAGAPCATGYPTSQLGRHWQSCIPTACDRGRRGACQPNEHGYPRSFAPMARRMYPRDRVALMRWLELCAVWCCEGWRIGTPRFSRLVAEGSRIFAEVIASDDDRLTFQRKLLTLLWERRDGEINLSTWLGEIYEGLVSELTDRSRTLDDERAILVALIARTVVKKVTLER